MTQPIRPPLPLLLLTLLALPLRAAEPTPAAPNAKDITALCARHQAAVQKLIDAKDPARAITATGEYEQALTALYPAPQIANGAFKSTSHRLDFTLPFAKQWTPQTAELSKELAPFAAMGVELLGALRGATEEENLMLLCMDADMLMRRMGFAADKQQVSLISQARQMGSRLGNIETERTTRIAGGFQAVRMRITGQRAVEMVTLQRDNRLYFLVMTGNADTQQEEVAKRMDQWVAALKFHDPDPATATKAAAIRNKLAKTAPGAAPRDAAANLSPLLASAGELAALGEYREAVIQLADLRAALAQTLPKPQVQGQAIVYPDYGVTLKNPDPERWKSQVYPAGASYFLVLEDQSSVTPGIVGVVVMDPVLLFGAASLSELGPQAPESKAKEMISSMGRGALLNVGSKLENERWRKFQNRLAYEGLAVAKMPNSKVKGILIRGSRALYMVMLIGPPQNLDTYEKLLEANLKIDDATPAAPTPR